MEHLLNGFIESIVPRALNKFVLILNYLKLCVDKLQIYNPMKRNLEVHPNLEFGTYFSTS